MCEYNHFPSSAGVMLTSFHVIGSNCLTAVALSGAGSAVWKEPQMQPVGVCAVFLEGRSAVTTDSHLAAARLRGARGGWHTLLSFPFISFTSRGSIIPHTQCSLKRVRTLSDSVSSAVFAHSSSISSSGSGSTVSLSSNPSIAAFVPTI